MAILKHISSKNANYGDAEKYLTFEHDEFTMKPTLDADGRLIPRVDYRISSLNCGGEDFAVACMRANLRYQKKPGLLHNSQATRLRRTLYGGVLLQKKKKEVWFSDTPSR